MAMVTFYMNSSFVMAENTEVSTDDVRDLIRIFIYITIYQR